MASLPYSAKGSLLEYRRPMQESSFDRLSTYNSETDIEEISIEQDIGFKLMHHDEEETPFQKLHRVVKGVQWQLAWAKDLNKVRGPQLEAEEIQFKNNSDIVTFNPNLFKAKHVLNGFLTSTLKTSLQKPHWERNKADLERIWTMLVKTKAFERYPEEIRKQMPKIIGYDVFEDGEKILHEGKFGLSLYFIIHGAVLIEVSHTDEKTGRLTKQVLREKIPGETFGEKIITRESSKMAAVVSKGRSEFLRVDKDEIEKVLKTSFRQETERRIKFLKSLAIFEQWVKSDIKLLNASSKVVEYNPNKVIVKDMREPQDYAYFIMTGQCQVVRQLPVIVEKLPFGREKFTLAPEDEIGEVKKNMKIDKRFESFKNLHLVVQILKEGDFFCVEEDIGKSSIISIAKTELLKIPKDNILCQQRGSFYNYIHALAMKKYPDRIQTFQRYLQGRNWTHYKKDLVSEIARRRSGRLSACLHDVPKSLQKIS